MHGLAPQDILPRTSRPAGFVVGLAGGTITLRGGIHDDKTTVDLAAGGTVTIGNDVAAGVVRLLSAAGAITVKGHVKPKVTSWPPKALQPSSGSTAPDEREWADPALLLPTGPRAGYWWENWGKTFGYVAPFRALPRTLDELVKAVQGSGTNASVRVLKSGQLTSVPVTVGLTTAKWVEIQSGITAGTKVVTSGQSQLVDGAPIRVR